MRSTDSTSWHPASWQSRKAAQQPTYDDADALSRVVAELARLPPIVVSWEIENLRERLAAVQRGEGFLLQGGDCAESFAECESDRIAKQLKVLLQMSLVLLSGMKTPGGTRRPHGRSVCQAALGRYGNARWRDACRPIAATW